LKNAAGAATTRFYKQPWQAPLIQKFLVKLFSKSFEERRLFEKRRHPKTFIVF